MYVTSYVELSEVKENILYQGQLIIDLLLTAVIFDPKWFFFF